VLLVDFTHYCWTYPLKSKCEVHQLIVDFIAYACTQFSLPIRCFQADNGTEFVNHAMQTSLAANGIVFHLSCPYTSPQNGKAERVLRTLNNFVCTLLIQASMPPSYWVEALSTATYLLNRRPSSIHHELPYSRLHGSSPAYDHLRVFSCLCYPNLQATSQHKLAPRSAACVFLGYPSSHKGYRCLDISTHKIIIS
jgi:transposase InsO family protein